MYDIKNLNIWEKKSSARPSNEYLKIEISYLNLSVRSYNCLRRAGCDTIGDVLKLIENDENGLRKIRNLGSRSETEIMEKIEQFRSQDHTEVIIQDDDEDDDLPIVKRKKISAQQIWDSYIEDYPLSNYARSRLKQHGISQVKDLYATDPKNEPGWYAVRELFEKIPV